MSLKANKQISCTVPFRSERVQSSKICWLLNVVTHEQPLLPRKVRLDKMNTSKNIALVNFPSFCFIYIRNICCFS